jgi:hypothetical protein
MGRLLHNLPPSEFITRVKQRRLDMQDGVYWLRVDGAESSEEGIAVISRGVVDGGGPAYIWQGRLAGTEGDVRGELHFRKWNLQAPPVLGMFKTASLGIKGQCDAANGSFDLEAHGHGHHVIRLRLRGLRIADPAEAASF